MAVVVLRVSQQLRLCSGNGRTTTLGLECKVCGRDQDEGQEGDSKVIG